MAPERHGPPRCRSSSTPRRAAGREPRRVFASPSCPALGFPQPNADGRGKPPGNPPGGFPMGVHRTSSAVRFPSPNRREPGGLAVQCCARPGATGGTAPRLRKGYLGRDAAGSRSRRQHPKPKKTEYAVFPVRLVIDRLWADPPIASEGVIRFGTRSKRGTTLGPRHRGFLQLASHLHRGRGP